jgi:hypothetical protein
MPVKEPEEELMPITQKETMACPEKTEVRLEKKEPTSVETNLRRQNNKKSPMKIP